MTTVIKNLPHGQIVAAQAWPLGHELAGKAAALGATCLSASVDDTGVATDAIIFEFDVAPDDTALDAAIAAFPSTGTPASGTFASTKGTAYLIGEEPIGEGEVVVFDVHVLAALGTAADFEPKWSDWYIIAYRRTGEGVRRDAVSGPSPGLLPGFRIHAVGTATTVQIYASWQRSGQVTILDASVEIEARGKVPT